MSDLNSGPGGSASSRTAASVERLATEFGGVFSHETVVRALIEASDRLSREATVMSPFFPTLVERFAHDQLRAAAQVEGLISKAVPEVLFVCEHNAGRSQMAAAIAHHLGDGHVGVRCAGSNPGDHIYPTVTEAMAELGFDVSQEFPKPLTDTVVRAADVVVTMGCGEACPVYPGKHYEDWPVADPAYEPIETVREIRADIERHVRDLLSGLLPAGSSADPVQRA